jgi:hypothetical protein
MDLPQHEDSRMIDDMPGEVRFQPEQLADRFVVKSADAIGIVGQTAAMQEAYARNPDAAVGVSPIEEPANDCPRADLRN